jgi:DNA-binding MarR family transcriptional regulator
MVESIPKYLLERVALLYAQKGTTEFRFDDAIEILGDSRSYLGQILPKLVKAGWIEKKVDPVDRRKKIYRIIAPDETIKKLGTRLQE